MKEFLITSVTYLTTFFTFFVQLLTIVKLKKEIMKLRGETKQGPQGGSASVQSPTRLLLASNITGLVLLSVLVFLTFFHPLAAPPVFGSFSIRGDDLNQHGINVSGPGGRREYIADVPFGVTFVKPPEVQLSLGGWETSSSLLQIYVVPNSTKRESFKVHVLWKQEQAFGDAGIKLNYTCTGSRLN